MAIVLGRGFPPALSVADVAFGDDLAGFELFFFAGSELVQERLSTGFYPGQILEHFPSDGSGKSTGRYSPGFPVHVRWHLQPEELQ